MEEQNTLPFPYEFVDVTLEEQEYIDKTYGSIVNVYRCSRVGPKGYMVYEPYKKEAANIYNMPLRPSDVFVAGYPRSGLTWTQELVWLLKNSCYIKDTETPLTDRYSFLDFFMSFDENELDAIIKNIDSNVDETKVKEVLTKFAQPATQTLAMKSELSSRFIKTHLPVSLLNPDLLETAKMVYVARDPRDVAVSCYHHAKLFKIIRCPGGFKEFWNLFYRDMYVFCPILEHVKEAWELRHHRNMHFMFYEDYLKDPPAAISLVASFLRQGVWTSEATMRSLLGYLSIDNFRTNKSVNQEELREYGMLDPNESFIRKGEAGGWRDYFDEEMAQEAEQWIAHGLRDTDLRFPNFDSRLCPKY